jgi:putative DNA primase/helicase
MRASKKSIRKQVKAGTKPPAKAPAKANQQNRRVAGGKGKPANSSANSQAGQTPVNAGGMLAGPSTDTEPTGSIRVYPNYPRTDAGNAELFARGFANKARFDHRRGRWLIWLGHWWAEDEKEMVLQAAKKIARFRLQYSTTIDNATGADLEAKWALRSESRPRLEAMLKLAQSEHPLSDPGKGWDANPWLLGVPNGVVDLRTGQLSDGNQSDKITMHTNVPFNPSSKAPRWEQFFDQIFGGNQELIDYVQRAAGYSLTGDVSEQVLFLAYGTGANGKSTFLEVLRHIIGTYAYNLPFSAFELKARSAIPNEIAALSAKRFVTAIETNESAELNEGRIKALTGSDPITARFLYREFFTFIPTSKYWLAFNHKGLRRLSWILASRASDSVSAAVHG